MENLYPQYDRRLANGIAIRKATFKKIQLCERLFKPFLAGQGKRYVVVARIGIALTVVGIELDYLLIMGGQP